MSDADLDKIEARWMAYLPAGPRATADMLAMIREVRRLRATPAPADAPMGERGAQFRRRAEAVARTMSPRDGVFYCSNCGHITSALEWRSLRFLPERCLGCGERGNGGHHATAGTMKGEKP